MSGSSSDPLKTDSCFEEPEDFVGEKALKYIDDKRKEWLNEDGRLYTSKFDFSTTKEELKEFGLQISGLNKLFNSFRDDKFKEHEELND